jgi:hypothetical protein
MWLKFACAGNGNLLFVGCLLFNREQTNKTKAKQKIKQKARRRRSPFAHPPADPSSSRPPVAPSLACVSSHSRLLPVMSLVVEFG